MNSMSEYLIQVTYGEPFYSMQPIQFNHDIRLWYESWLPEVSIDYDRIWNELKPAFLDWRFARAKYAEDLEPHKRLSYEEHTDYLTNYLFKEIQGLVETRNDNVIWDREHPNNN